MASGTLGVLDLATATYQVVYTVPAAKLATCTITFCNRGETPANVRLATTELTLTPSDGQFLEYRYPLTAAGTDGASMEKSGVVMEAARKVVVWGSLSHVSVVVYGYEE